MILSSILRLIREYIRYNTFIQNPNPRPDPWIFLKIRPNPSAYKILRSVTTLAAITPKRYEIGVRLVGSEMCIRDRYIWYNTFIQNPNLRPDPRIFLKIRPNPSAYKILRSVTTLPGTHTQRDRSRDEYFRGEEG